MKLPMQAFWFLIFFFNCTVGFQKDANVRESSILSLDPKGPGRPTFQNPFESASFETSTLPNDDSTQIEDPGDDEVNELVKPVQDADIAGQENHSGSTFDQQVGSETEEDDSSVPIQSVSPAAISEISTTSSKDDGSSQVISPSTDSLSDMDGEGFYPCHSSKGKIQSSVSCKRVEIPPLLCKRCGLRPTTASGQFDICNDIFETETPSCKEAMMEYIDANKECDPIRAAEVPLWINGDENARQGIDYFLYSVCELCCDCIPMGAKKAEFRELKAEHSSSTPFLWNSRRGNCPAHAQYDLCTVFPNVQYLTSINGTDELDSPACPFLNDWMNSKKSANWETSPEMEIGTETIQFLDGALSALMCHRSSIWKSCYVMENKQNHIALPSNAEPMSEPAPTTDEIESEAVNPATVSGQENDATGGSENNPTFSSGSCFPASAIVELEDGRLKRMDEIEIGDRVRDSERTFSEVYMFSHRDYSSSDISYVRITTSLTEVTMTSGHYIYVRTKDNTKSTIAVPSIKVRTDDLVFHYSGEWEPVIAVNLVPEKGLYNPHTVSGDISVNGIITSTFTQSVPSRTAIALLSPFRALFATGLVGEKELGHLLTNGVGHATISDILRLIVKCIRTCKNITIQ